MIYLNTAGELQTVQTLTRRRGLRRLILADTLWSDRFVRIFRIKTLKTNFRSVSNILIKFKDKQTYKLSFQCGIH